LITGGGTTFCHYRTLYGQIIFVASLYKHSQSDRGGGRSYQPLKTKNYVNFYRKRFNKTLRRKVRKPDGFPHPRRSKHPGKNAADANLTGVTITAVATDIPDHKATLFLTL
jgi:hypothetical protein